MKHSGSGLVSWPQGHSMYLPPYACVLCLYKARSEQGDGHESETRNREDGRASRNMCEGNIIQLWLTNFVYFVGYIVTYYRFVQSRNCNIIKLCTTLSELFWFIQWHSTLVSKIKASPRREPNPFYQPADKITLSLYIAASNVGRMTWESLKWCGYI